MVKPTAVADCGGSCRTDMLYRRARCIIGQYTVALYKRLYSSGSLNTAIQNVSIASSIDILYRPIQQIQYTAIQPIHCTALYTPPLSDSFFLPPPIFIFLASGRRERLRRGPSGPRPSGPTASGRAPSGRRASGARPPAEESLDEQWRIITIPLSSPLSTVRWFLLPPYSTQALESGV